MKFAIPLLFIVLTTVAACNRPAPPVVTRLEDEICDPTPPTTFAINLIACPNPKPCYNLNLPLCARHGGRIG